MQNANGSSPTPNLGNRRVRGTKPEGAVVNGASGNNLDDTTAAAMRRANGLALRRARERAPVDDDGAAELERPAKVPKGKTAKVAAIAALLRGEDNDDDRGGDDAIDDGTGDDGAPGGAGLETSDDAPQTLEAIAERLGVDVADLWETVEFRDGAGKAHKLGALKDLLQADTDQDARELAFAEQKTTDENDLMRQRQELEFVLRSLPKSAVTPELTTRAKAERERVLKLEGERLAAAIPEWKNAETRKTERTAIGAWMTQYGFGAGDLERMYDHRMQKLLRDSWQRHERMTKALAKVKEQRGAAGAPARSNAAARRPKAPTVGPNATRTQKVAAVAQLLRDSMK